MYYINSLISSKRLSLNSILMMLTTGVLFLFIFKDKSTSYLFGSYLQVCILIGVTFFSLILNSRLKNDFLEILNVLFVIFYICRIPFVLGPEASTDIFDKGVNIGQIAWYINILSFQYLSLIICLLVVNPRIPRWHLNNNFSEFVFVRVIIFSFIIILFGVYLAIFVLDIHKSVLSNIPSILKTIFTIKNALMLIILSSFMVERKIFLKYKYLIALCILLGIFSIIYQGGKSILLEIILITYLVKVVLSGPMFFRLREIFITSIFVLFSLFFYAFGAVIRNHRVQGGSDGGFFVQLKMQLLEKSNIYDWIGAISYRIGYLDFYLDMVSNPIYEKYVSFTYYFKSTIDKLTPGFDIFQAPFMSRMIYEAYYNSNSTVMNSNLVTVFGESHIIFGFFSFCFFLPLLLFFKFILSSLRTSSRISDALLYTFLAYLFYWWLTGMGLDMWITTMVYDGIFTFVVICLIWYWNKRET
jgi:hypothetical protein